MSIKKETFLMLLINLGTSTFGFIFYLLIEHIPFHELKEPIVIGSWILAMLAAILITYRGMRERRRNKVWSNQ